jgi:hypothetical protein
MHDSQRHWRERKFMKICWQNIQSEIKLNSDVLLRAMEMLAWRSGKCCDFFIFLYLNGENEEEEKYE